MLHLANDVYSKWERYLGNICGSIRQYKRNDKGDMFATRCGLTFNPKGYAELKKLIHSMVLIKDAAAIEVEKEPKTGPQHEFILPIIAGFIKELIINDRLENGNNSKEHPGGAEMTLALEIAQRRKLAQAALFSTGETTMKQFVSFDFENYWVSHFGQIHEAVYRAFDV